MSHICFPCSGMEFKYIYIHLQDKLGPFCRSAVDCAIILDAILGKDPDDLSSRDISLDDPFSVDITNLTVGYLDDAEMEVRVRWRLFFWLFTGINMLSAFSLFVLLTFS